MLYILERTPAAIDRWETVDVIHAAPKGVDDAQPKGWSGFIRHFGLIDAQGDFSLFNSEMITCRPNEAEQKKLERINKLTELGYKTYDQTRFTNAFAVVPGTIA